MAQAVRATRRLSIDRTWPTKTRDFDHLDGAGQLAAMAALRPRVDRQPGRCGRRFSVLGSDRGDGDRHARSRLAGRGAPGDRLLRWLPDLPLPAWAGRFLALCLTPATISASLGASFLFAVADVDPDGGGDDAAVGGADDPHLLRDRRHRPGQGRSRRSTRWSSLPAISRSGWSPRLASPASACSCNRDAGRARSAGYAAIAALGIAGLYQFSSLKEACLKKCRNPVRRSCSRAGAAGRCASSGSAPSRASGASAAAGH